MHEAIGPLPVENVTVPGTIPEPEVTVAVRETAAEGETGEVGPATVIEVTNGFGAGGEDTVKDC